MMFATTRRSQESGARDVVDSFTAPAIRKTFPESWIFDNIEESQGYINQYYSNGLNCGICLRIVHYLETAFKYFTWFVSVAIIVKTVLLITFMSTSSILV